MRRREGSFCFCFLSFPPQMLFVLDFVKVGLTHSDKVYMFLEIENENSGHNKYLSFSDVTVVIVTLNPLNLEPELKNF